jgi:hypothetical protein
MELKFIQTRFRDYGILIEHPHFRQEHIQVISAPKPKVTTVPKSQE